MSPPRARLALLPTPLVPAPRLSEEAGLEIWFKRDDLTGLGLGGNKVRALEFIIGEAEAGGADCLVTGGGPRSNWVMLAALAAVTRRMESHLVYFGSAAPLEGNLLLVSGLPGVHVRFTGNPERASVDPVLDEVAARLVETGRRPHLVGRGGAGPVGALGYLHATRELDDQLVGWAPAEIWTATGSCGTQAGLVAGHRLARSPRRVVGVSVHRPVAECQDRIAEISQGCLDLIGASEVGPADWCVLGDQLDRDAAREARVREAAQLVARTEGVFLDPEFCAPAMAELLARREEPAGPVVFLLTGGAPTLFHSATSP